MNILITGGAGFIGINASEYFLSQNHKVTILDNFSRKGSASNLTYLKTVSGKKFTVIEGDIRIKDVTDKAAKGADVILHLAGQVAVTSSVLDPRDDFESNALGTFNVLESARKQKQKPIVLYSSTNKVYGGLEDVKTKKTKTRYEFVNLPNGVSEERNIDFHSPYGCSKGAADQYVRDYHRIYDLPTVVLRQSCIFGTRQFGVEDQGWVAWFLIALVTGKKITIYGDGKQVRDLLFVDDLIQAYDAAIKKIDVSAGKIYNVGGGITNSLSIWYEFRPILEKLFEKEISVSFEDARPGDQPIYISDIRKISKELNWKPRIGVEDGITRLFEWVSSNKNLFISK